jgi:hypothetical protein
LTSWAAVSFSRRTLAHGILTHEQGVTGAQGNVLLLNASVYIQVAFSSSSTIYSHVKSRVFAARFYACWNKNSMSVIFYPYLTVRTFDYM